MARAIVLLQMILSSRMGYTGLVLLAGYALIALLAPWIAPFPIDQKVGRPFLPPQIPFWLGTNDLGQDILSELIYGARISLTVGVVAAVLAVGMGAMLGLLAGYVGGRWDSMVMRLADLKLVLPFYPLMILLSAALEPSSWNLAFILGLLWWPFPARVIRSQVLSLKTRGYVLAARAVGAGPGHVIWRHVLPEVLPLVLSKFVQFTGAAILSEASLAFLGLGDVVHRSWGMTLHFAMQRNAFFTGAWKWWVIPPGLLIATTVLAFVLIGHALEEYVNPRLRKG